MGHKHILISFQSSLQPFSRRMDTAELCRENCLPTMYSVYHLVVVTHHRLDPCCVLQQLTAELFQGYRPCNRRQGTTFQYFYGGLAICFNSSSRSRPAASDPIKIPTKVSCSRSCCGSANGYIGRVSHRISPIVGSLPSASPTSSSRS